MFTDLQEAVRARIESGAFFADPHKIAVVGEELTDKNSDKVELDQRVNSILNSQGAVLAVGRPVDQMEGRHTCIMTIPVVAYEIPNANKTGKTADALIQRARARLHDYQSQPFWTPMRTTNSQPGKAADGTVVRTFTATTRTILKVTED